MDKELKDKIALFRILHGVDHVYIAHQTEQLFTTVKNDFTGECIQWYDDGVWCKITFCNGLTDGPCQISGSTSDYLCTGCIFYTTNGQRVIK